MKSIINLTQHNASTNQVEEGVVNLPADELQQLKTLLTFSELPEGSDIEQRATAIAQLAQGYEQAMIGGAPYLMSALEQALKANGIKPLYAFTQRVSEESVNDAGEVVKTNVFKHMGFVPA